MKTKLLNLLYLSLCLLLIPIFAFIDIKILSFNIITTLENNSVYSYNETPRTLLSFEYLQKGDLYRQYTFDSIIKRDTDNVFIVSVPLNKTITCNINSIINSKKDISTDYEVEEVKNGRVLNIKKNSDSYLISIDLATNYFCYTMIPNYYYNYFEFFLKNPNKINTYNYIDYTFLDLTFKEGTYNKDNGAFLMRYQFNSITSSNLYNNSKAISMYLVESFINACYINYNCLKDIDENYIGVLELITDYQNSILEEIKVNILGVIDSYIILDNSSNTYVNKQFKKQDYRITNSLVQKLF